MNKTVLFSKYELLSSLSQKFIKIKMNFVAIFARDIININLRKQNFWLLLIANISS